MNSHQLTHWLTKPEPVSVLNKYLCEKQREGVYSYVRITRCQKSGTSVSSHFPLDLGTGQAVTWPLHDHSHAPTHIWAGVCVCVYVYAHTQIYTQTHIYTYNADLH